MTGELVAPRTARRPVHTVLEGRTCRLRPLDAARDAASLFPFVHGPQGNELWDYLPVGPFADLSTFQAYVGSIASSTDPLFFCVADPADTALGWLSLLRIDPSHGVIEVGFILYSTVLQRTIAATEAQYLLARHVFDELGFRRYEWKCNSLNEPSKRAAARFGFTPEGLFRQHMIVKGRNRDTAWFALLDQEWSKCRMAFERWLAPENFDEAGRQLRSLEEIRAACPA